MYREDDKLLLLVLIINIVTLYLKDWENDDDKFIIKIEDLKREIQSSFEMKELKKRWYTIKDINRAIKILKDEWLIKLYKNWEIECDVRLFDFWDSL